MWTDLVVSLYLATIIATIFMFIGYYIYRIINRSAKGKSMHTVNNPFNFIPASQEDPKSQESLKRCRKSFTEQQQQMQARAMKAHAADCPDPWTCTKNPCFIPRPDKIVYKTIVKRKTNSKRAFDEREYQNTGRRDEDNRELFEKLKKLSKQ